MPSHSTDNPRVTGAKRERKRESCEREKLHVSVFWPIRRSVLVTLTRSDPAGSTDSPPTVRYWRMPAMSASEANETM